MFSSHSENVGGFVPLIDINLTTLIISTIEVLMLEGTFFDDFSGLRPCR